MWMLFFIICAYSTLTHWRPVKIGTYNTLYVLLVFLTFTTSYITFSIPVIGSPRLILAIVLIVGWPHRARTILQYMDKQRILIPYLAFTAYLLFSTLFIHRLYSLQNFYEILGNAVFLLLTASIIYHSTKREILIVYGLMALSIFLNTVLYSDEYFSFLSVFNFPDGVGTTHQLAGRSAMYSLPMMLYISANAKSNVTRGIAYLVASMAIIGAYVSGARTPLIGVIAIVVFWGRKPKRIILILIVFAILSQIVPTSSTNFATERIDRLTNLSKGGAHADDLTEVSFRIENTAIAFKMFLDHPLFGIGHNGWYDYHQTYTLYNTGILASHNSYASALAEYGLFGILLMIWYMYSLLKGNSDISLYRYLDELKWSSYCGIIAILILGITSNSLMSRNIYLCLGIILGANVLKNRRSMEYKKTSKPEEALNNPNPCSIKVGLPVTRQPSRRL